MSRAGRPAGRGVDPDRERRVGRVADAQTPGRTPGQDAATVGGERPCPPGAASSDASSHDRPGPHLGSSAVLARDEIPPRRNHADSWLAQPTRLASGAGFPSRSTRRWTGCTSGRQGARGRCALSCATTARAAASNAAGNVAADDLGGVPGPRSLVRPRAGSAVRSPLSRMTRARSWERLSRCRRAPRTSLANWLGGRMPIQGLGPVSRRLDGALVVRRRRRRALLLRFRSPGRAHARAAADLVGARGVRGSVRSVRSTGVTASA